MGDGLKRAVSAARDTQSRRISLTREERMIIRMCISIAAEDGSIYGGWQPEDRDYLKRQVLLDKITKKLS